MFFLKHTRFDILLVEMRYYAAVFTAVETIQHIHRANCVKNRII